MKFEDTINCKGDKERMEAARCSICETNHTISFEFYNEKIEEAIKKLPWEKIKGEAYIEINALLKELGLESK